MNTTSQLKTEAIGIEFSSNPVSLMRLCQVYEQGMRTRVTRRPPTLYNSQSPLLLPVTRNALELGKRNDGTY